MLDQENSSPSVYLRIKDTDFPNTFLKKVLKSRFKVIKYYHLVHNSDVIGIIIHHIIHYSWQNKNQPVISLLNRRLRDSQSFEPFTHSFVQCSGFIHRHFYNIDKPILE